MISIPCSHTICLELAHINRRENRLNKYCRCSQMGSPLDIRRQLTISLLCFKMGAGTWMAPGSACLWMLKSLVMEFCPLEVWSRGLRQRLADSRWFVMIFFLVHTGCWKPAKSNYQRFYNFKTESWVYQPNWQFSQQNFGLTMIEW